jgi:hypothetical protein
LRSPPYQLLLMSRIQSGDGAARTDAEDEEHEPFSHGSPPSPGSRLPERFWMLTYLLYPFEAGWKLCGVCAAGFGGVPAWTPCIAVHRPCALIRARAVADSATIFVIVRSSIELIGFVDGAAG